MERTAPDHAIEYCYEDISDTYFRKLNDIYNGVNSFVYKLRCSCGCDKFNIYQDNHPSVFAQCSCCEKTITVYDLKYYPAAKKLKKEYEKTKINESLSFVYVNYEYDDEFLYEDDVEFDANDITWGKIFIVVDNQLIKILDDETT